MKYLLPFIFACCLSAVNAQSCMRITSKIAPSDAINSVEAGVSETTVCEDKSVTAVKNGPLSTRYVVNPAEKTSLMLVENGAGHKMASVIPIFPEQTKRPRKTRLEDNDFHFTGQMKMIAGYNCEQFTIQNEKGATGSGYLSRELKIGTDLSESSMLQLTSLGTIMEFTAVTEIGKSITMIVTKVEMVSIENEAEFFSTKIPEGYTDLNTVNPYYKE
jgi:hypothetical protein